MRGSLDGLIDDLNNQIISFSANTGIDMDELNKLAEINKALDEIKAQLPTEAEQLNALNKNIKNFKTTLAISEISSSDFLGQIQGDTRAFSAQMKEHSDSMRTVANVKAMEQYKKLLDQFKLQLDDRNAKVAKQTRNAAMSQGYVQVGDKFIKKGATAGVYGVVNAYEYFDTENEFIKALSETGVDSVNGEGLVTFLKEKSQIEVTAYFHTQKLAIQSAMNKLMGTGDASVRESSRDAKDIGRIGVWIGGQGNSDLANRTLTEMNKRGLYSRDAYMRDLLANNAMFGGFGQLGSATWRPGEKQIVGGFYTQLSWMGGEMGKRDAAHSQGRYTPGPAAAMLNQFNVGLMAANSYKNVEMAHATNGTSRGYMWEAQGLAMISQPLVAVGNGLAVAATLSGGAAWMAPVGLAIKALGESIKVDAQTGKRSFKLTDKQKVNLAVDSAMSALTMGANSYFTTAKMGYNQAKFLKESLGYVKMATNLGMAGVQEDEHGKIDGWKADENVALSATGILVGKLYGNYTGAKHSLATEITNKFIGIGNEYYKFKNNRANQYAQLANPGPEGIGGLFGMGIDAYVARYQEARKLEEKIKEIHGEDIYDALVEKGRVPNPWDPVREKHAMDLLAGAASIANENRRKALIAKVFGIDASIKAIKTGDAGTWVHAALEAEFGGSASFDEVYYEAEKRLLKRAQDGKNSPDDIQHVIAELGGNPNALFAEETTTRYNQRAKSFDRAWAYKQNENERREAVSKITKQFMPQNVHDNGNGTFSYEDPVEQKSVTVSKDEYYKTVEERRTLVDKTPGVDKSAGYNFSHVAGTEVRLENGVVVAANDPQAYSDWFFGERALLSASLRPPTDPRSTSQKVSDFFDRLYGVDKVSLQERVDRISAAYKANYYRGLVREGFENIKLFSASRSRGMVNIGQSFIEGTISLFTTNPLTTLKGLRDAPSNSLSLAISLNSMPPYFDRHRDNVVLWIPCFRHKASVAIPASDSFRISLI